MAHAKTSREDSTHVKSNPAERQEASFKKRQHLRAMEIWSHGEEEVSSPSRCSSKIQESGNNTAFEEE